MDNSDGNVLKTIAYGMSKKRLTRNIGQRPISWEKGRPTGPERTSSRASDPQRSH